MNITHLIFSFITGGTETMLVDIINEQVKTEQVNLLIINDIINKELLAKIDCKVRIYKINRKAAGKNPFPFAKLNFLLWRLNPDIIHCHNMNGISILLPCFYKKTYATIHTTIHATIYDKYFSKYAKLFVISRAVQRCITARGLNSTVVYNGIDLSKIAVRMIREHQVRNGTTYHMVQVSRLDYKTKGQHLLIEAVKKLVYESKITNIHLDFIGDTYASEYVTLLQMVEDARLSNYITFLGLKDRTYIYSHLRDYDLLIQPSLYEGFGLTVAEAMAAKIHVLVSDIEGPMEVIDGGKYGYYFKTGNSNDLAVQVQKIITNSDFYSQNAMIEAAYQFVMKNFDIKNTAQKYIEEYEK